MAYFCRFSGTGVYGREEHGPSQFPMQREAVTGQSVALATASARVTKTGPVIVIPAYKPSPILPQLVRELCASNSISAMVVVNDGSGPEYSPIFASLRELAGVHVLDHAVNLGKGAALRTGLNYVACKFPTSVGIVTADADGQHTVPDILATAQRLSANPQSLVLGTRQFEGDVPVRSKFGNTATRYIMRAVTGQKVTDTQTGLRGIPMDFVPDLLRSKATGYDFELDMLVKSKYMNRHINEVPIATVYIDHNRSSHFDPLWDSMRIYFVFIRFAGVSLITAAIDNLVFILALSFSFDLLFCQAAARLTAGMFNYYANKKGVFHSKTQNTIALPKYWLSVLITGGVSYALIHTILTYTSMGVISAKVLAETIMFSFSFVIQRDFVFFQRSTT
jgi:putative flippase GtrA